MSAEAGNAVGNTEALDSLATELRLTRMQRTFAEALATDRDRRRGFRSSRTSGGALRCPVLNECLPPHAEELLLDEILRQLDRSLVCRRGLGNAAQPP